MVLQQIVEKPGVFSSLFGITLCLVIFGFTFAVIGLYMFCKLPAQQGKLCYFEQYRTIIENETVNTDFER
jgi:hypothetical protein